MLRKRAARLFAKIMMCGHGQGKLTRQRILGLDKDADARVAPGACSSWAPEIPCEARCVALSSVSFPLSSKDLLRPRFEHVLNGIRRSALRRKIGRSCEQIFNRELRGYLFGDLRATLFARIFSRTIEQRFWCLRGSSRCKSGCKAHYGDLSCFLQTC